LAAVFVACACGPGELTLTPSAITEDEWATPFRLSGLEPAAYLEARGDTLERVDDLRLTVDGSETGVSDVDGSGLVFTLAGPLAVGDHDVVLHARGVDHVATPRLSVGSSDASVRDAVGDTAMPPTDVGMPPVLPDWTRRRQITLDNSAQAEALMGFTALIRLDVTRVDYGATQDDGGDLRFVDADGVTELAYEIERWDEAGESVVWVHVPRIEASSTHVLWMFYGHTTVADGQQPEASWSAEHRGVWHLDADVRDSTSGANHGTELNAARVEGMVGGGRELDGVSGYVDVGSAAGLDDIFAGTGGTISLLFRADSWGEADYSRLLDKSNTNQGGEGWAFQLDGANVHTNNFTIRMERDFDPVGLVPWNAADRAVRLGDWHYVALTYDDRASGTLTIYMDGRQSPNDGLPAGSGTPRSDAAHTLRIGNRSGFDDRTFDGILDEVRIEKGMRSAAWVAAQHRSLTDAMAIFGPEEVP